MSGFFKSLTQELVSNIYNCYGSDNWDEQRFGKNSWNLAAFFLAKMNVLLKPFGISVVVPGRIRSTSEGLLHDFGDGLSRLYCLLEDEYSKTMLTKVIAYRMLGHHRMKLPLNTAEYWAKRNAAGSLAKNGSTLRIRFRNWSLNLFELDEIGYRLRLYSTPLGIVETFLLKHYVYSKRVPAVRAEDGDCVIDGGGCWGDTALFFAHEVGPRGKVYTFECVPENLEIMERNLGLNPELNERVDIVRHALWSSSHLVMFGSVNGPGSRVSSAKAERSDVQVATLSIDDFVTSRAIPRVDFIKMDIEGAELSALKGATETIRTHKPKLAISIYHSLDDFVDIPDYLSSLGVRYHYYLDHVTIYGEETVLFGTPV